MEGLDDLWVFYLSLGLILGVGFVVVMCKFVLPEADQIVKKNYGPLHAVLFTRCGCLCIGLPLYMFSIWMIVVATFSKDGGFEVVEEICPEDMGCASTFAFGLENFDKEACTSPDCTDEELYARSGSDPIEFEFGLGVYADEPDISTVTYTLLNTKTAESSGSEENCECADGVGPRNICDQWTGCFGDVDPVDTTTTCLEPVSGECTKWEVATDSAQQFSFATCTRNSSSVWTCEEFTMRYYYPNVFFAALVTILWVFPLSVVLYCQIRTQARKLPCLQCPDPDIYIYNQGAGAGKPVCKEDMDTGYFYEEDTDRKEKARSCTRRDIGLIVVVFPAIMFFIYVVTKAAGRIGILMVALCYLLILLQQVATFACFCMKKKTKN